MEFLKKLFGPRTPATPPRDVAALAAPLALPALQLLPGLPVRGAAPVHSWFLGEPDLPPEVAPPSHRGKPLGHLATIDLADALAGMSVDWLPGHGSLAFFYDLQEQPPGAPEHRGAWRVIHRAQRSTSRSPDSRRMSFRSFSTYPPAERAEAVALGLSEAEWDRYCDLTLAQTGSEFVHQLGGYPSLIQGDCLELESQFASNGLKLTEDSEKSPQGRGLAAGAADWRLLLQIASDPALDFVWGDGGSLYFMIREHDARAGRFDQVWMVDQCF